MTSPLRFSGRFLLVWLACCCWLIALSASQHGHGQMMDGDGDGPHLMESTNDYFDHPCRRKCRHGEKPMVCEYDFEVTWYSTMSRACMNCTNVPSDCRRPGCIPGSGTQRGVAVANRCLPGPSVEVCIGDRIRVKVENMLQDGETTTIHWHGIHQRSTPFMDGVPFGTQCPIMPGASFTYEFKAEKPGTYFWHSHTGFQRLDGLAGPLIVREPDDPHEDLYHKDNLRALMFQDWFPNELGINRFAVQNFGRTGFNAPQMILNGVMGSKPASSNKGNASPSVKLPPTEYRLDPRMRYRFRAINNAVLLSPIKIQISGHNLIVIASDGAPIQPVVTKTLTLMPAETYDFVPYFTGKEKNREATYWLTAKIIGDGAAQFNASTVAEISYNHGINPKSANVYEATGGICEEVVEEVNYWSWDPYLLKENRHKGKKVSLLEALTHKRGIEGEPDHQFVIEFDIDRVKIPRPQMADDKDQKAKTKPPETRFIPRFNNISSSMSPVPLLTQWEEVPKDQYCNAEHRKCPADEYCPCIHMIYAKLNSLVEIILIDRGSGDDQHDLHHPIHLHGYHFRVVAQEAVHGNLTGKDVLRMDRKGKIKRNLKYPPLKTVVGVPTGGYAIIRFVADNPGPWMIHCHLDFHMEEGMMMFLRVGHPTDPVPPPHDFPRCKPEWPKTKPKPMPKPKSKPSSSSSSETISQDYSSGGSSEKMSQEYSSGSYYEDSYSSSSLY